jgi:hypothetical protein
MKKGTGMMIILYVIGAKICQQRYFKRMLIV